MAVNQKRRFNDASEQAESEENSQNSFAFTDDGADYAESDGFENENSGTPGKEKRVVVRSKPKTVRTKKRQRLPPRDKLPILQQRWVQCRRERTVPIKTAV